MKDFIERNKDTVFRYWTYKRNYTPYEIDLKDPMQSDLIEEECSYGRFIEAVNLGYDWLIGIVEWDAVEPYKYIDYVQLSSIKFAYSSGDQE